MNEVILVMGFPASGKSTLAHEYASKGYILLNRDTTGGRINDLVIDAEQKFAEGTRDFVFDNLYATVQSRKPVIDWAKRHGLEVHCKWMQTSIEDAQYNACLRMIKKYGHILTEDEIKRSKDPIAIPAVVLFKYRKDFQIPTAAEGFASISKIPFKRIMPKDYAHKALILDYDGTLRKTKSGDKYPLSCDDIEILSNRAEIIQKYKDQGYLILGVSNQSAIGKGQITKEEAIKCFDKTNELIGIDIDYKICPHTVPPISCYCRKPMPGLGVELIETYRLDPSQSIMVGDLKTDKTFAFRCGFRFIESNTFFP